MFGFLKKKKPKKAGLDLEAEIQVIVSCVKDKFGVDPIPENKEEKDENVRSVSFKLEKGDLMFILRNPRPNYNYAEMDCIFLQYYKAEDYPSPTCDLYNNVNTFLRKTKHDSIHTVTFEHIELNVNSETLLMTANRMCEAITDPKFIQELTRWDKKKD